MFCVVVLVTCIYSGRLFIHNWLSLGGGAYSLPFHTLERCVLVEVENFAIKEKTTTCNAMFDLDVFHYPLE